MIQERFHSFLFGQCNKFDTASILFRTIFLSDFEPHSVVNRAENFRSFFFLFLFNFFLPLNETQKFFLKKSFLKMKVGIDPHWTPWLLSIVSWVVLWPFYAKWSSLGELIGLVFLWV